MHRATTADAHASRAVEWTYRKADDVVSVGVTVDLEYGPKAGGHVKCWERFCAAAGYFRRDVDLTVYALGDAETIVPLAPNARFHLLPPRRGTRALGLEQGGGHTDLAGHHPELARRLKRHDVLHITSAFALSRTAADCARDGQRPLIASVHTDLAAFARIYTTDVLAHLFGAGRLGRTAAQLLPVAGFCGRAVERRVTKLLARCDRVLVSDENMRRRVAAAVPAANLSLLRRGIDTALLAPRHRNRAALLQQFRVPGDPVVVMFVGRIDETKRALHAAKIVHALAARGYDMHLLAVGEGRDAAAIKTLLGARASLPGNLPQAKLAPLYASADLFVFPSITETYGNVVLEAKASGLPVFVQHGAATAALIAADGVDGIAVADAGVEAWVQALIPYVADVFARRRLSLGARRFTEEFWPGWRHVFEQDLLSVWRAAVGAAARSERPQPGAPRAARPAAVA